MAEQSIQPVTEESVREEAERTILREALRRYRNELSSIDEREELWDRIVHMRRRLGLA
jgi:hypothetical protein